MRILPSIILTAAIAVLLPGFQSNTTSQPEAKDPAVTAVEWDCHRHVAFGLPGTEDQLLCRDGYAVGYDYDRKVPSWVAYHLTQESTGKKQKRSNRFSEDEEIPAPYRSTLSDYKRSGYDRGHMAPAATVDFSTASMQESFLLSNITPQLPGLNRQGWRYLEESVRDWTDVRGDLYVVTGVLFEGTEITIGNRLAVPSSFYKVIFDPAHSDGIAFIVPHRNVSKGELPTFIVSIDQVEARSGLDFNSLLPDAIEADIEDDIELMWCSKNCGSTQELYPNNINVLLPPLDNVKYL